MPFGFVRLGADLYKNNSKIAVVLLCIFFLPVLSVSGCTNREDDIVSYDLQSLEPVSEAAAESEFSQDHIYVYVCGLVEKPGVYEVDSNARMFEVLELAGGVRDGADLSAVNQAQKVTDGQQIYIPEIGEAPQQGKGAAAGGMQDDGLVNINTADLAELMTLPGIGETRAQAIIDYRTAQGGYRTVEDIMNVTGIKEGLFGKIVDKIKV